MVFVSFIHELNAAGHRAAGASDTGSASCRLIPTRRGCSLTARKSSWRLAWPDEFPEMLGHDVPDTVNCMSSGEGSRARGGAKRQCAVDGARDAQGRLLTRIGLE